MAVTGRAAVANTDIAWFRHFRRNDATVVVDEVNFWRPVSQGGRFSVVDLGGPVFFRLKAPLRSIAGFGFFAGTLDMTVAMAWEFFGQANGDPTYSSFVGRIHGYRAQYGRDTSELDQQRITCLVLREAVFLRDEDWLPWDRREQWSDNVVAVKGYDLTEGVGTVLADLLAATSATAPEDLVGDFRPVAVDSRALAETLEPIRAGQGAFRIRLLAAYGGCAVTGEHALPVLDAAHIQPYLGPQSNHVQNGVVLRTDLHRLYDDGYITITPDHRLEVGSRLREEFDNGRAYYAMAGQGVRVPRDPRLQPSREALEWHADRVFR
jgi:putative restriction endonuclease